jgi:hypothetical protein
LSAENGLRLAPHPPSSPDLPPWEFFLDEDVNSPLQGIVFQSQEVLLAGIKEVLDEIPGENLECVFEHWMERLEWVSQNNGDDYPSPVGWSWRREKKRVTF